MFRKEIDRDIQGVIIVGQNEDANVSQELEEYVVTNELSKHFADFFASYKKGIIGTTPKMGVWISGFFGSGKSHFLKILSYILDNKEVGGKRALDYFIDDNKIEDSMVLADMKLAANTPTDVILFNIDSKSDSNGKENKDAIVNVFLKVFNEMQGYCGSMPHLADLERSLNETGKFDEFKSAFASEYGSSWEDSRQDFAFIQDTVVDVLTGIGSMSESAARNWCEKTMEPYKISIEDFAKRVKAYIDKKGNNHHVVFLVDEVGQYIGENSTLMLNLQTMTEELGKECMGKAWVVVTSQQDIDSITHVIGNDFSKIQGRFDTRLALSSANVDAVIKKRILEKTDTAAQTLCLYYDDKSTIIKNLIFFNDSVEKKLYSSADNFAEVYPFVPYQFNLLGSVLTSVRKHSSSGKHLSEGERSMLSMFKESAMQVMNEETGAIVPFHKFYDAIEKFLDHSHKGVIDKAYDNTQINPEGKRADVFAINVLKVLFLIKYVNEIEPNEDNITSLMIDHVDNDRVEVKGKVEKALDVLKKQMLVQKNGSLYTFLTDEEQEINREIHSQNVEMADVIKKLSDMIFETIYTDKKYQVKEFNGRYTFPFNQKVDNRTHKLNQNHKIGLNIVTPWYEGNADPNTLRMMSGQNNDVVIALPSDTSYLEELTDCLKIQKFLRLNSSNQVQKYKDIKDAKSREMQDHEENAKNYLTDDLKAADIYVNGNLFSTQSKDAGNRITDALACLVQKVYFKLGYIEVPMGEREIKNVFTSSNQMSMNLDDGKEINDKALYDVGQFVSSRSRMYQQVSMKAVKDHFMDVPYGFVEDDIYWLVARLFKKGELTFSVNGENVTLYNKKPDEIINYITKKAYTEKLLMTERPHVSDRDKQNVRTVMKELFQGSATSDDEDDIMQTFIKYADRMINDIKIYETEYKNKEYPGEDVLKKGESLLTSAQSLQSPAEFFTGVSQELDDFLDFAEDYEPIKSFFGGKQKEFFDKALGDIKKYNDNKFYISDEQLIQVINDMKFIVNKKEPYSDIQKLPELHEKFQGNFIQILENETEPIIDAINQAKDRVLEELEKKEYKSEKQQEYCDQFDNMRKEARSSDNIAIIRSYTDRADTLRGRILDKMSKLDQQIDKRKPDEAAEASGETLEQGDKSLHISQTEIQFKTRKILNISMKNVAGPASWHLESKEDVEKHLDSLRESILSQLDEDTILNIEL